MDIGDEHNYTIRLAFKTTNNEVEYEALLVGLAVIKSLATKKWK